jgi:hypothetical protein
MYTYILQLLLQQSHHILLDYYTLLVQILDDELMAIAVNIDDNGLDRRVAFDQHPCVRACGQTSIGIIRACESRVPDSPLIARGMMITELSSCVQRSGDKRRKGRTVMRRWLGEENRRDRNVTQRSTRLL